MKKQLIEASSNSLYSLQEDFERSSKSVMQEQETELLDNQLLESALKESLQAQTASKPRKPATKNPQPSLETILKMSSMGYSLEEVIEAYKPNEAGVSRMIDRILEARDKRLL